MLESLEMEMQGNQLPIIEIVPEHVSLEDRNQEVKYLSEISIKPDFQVHVAVNDNDNITDTGPEIKLTPFKVEAERNPQIEVKTEYEWLKEVNTEYKQSTKSEIEEVNAEYNQAKIYQTEVNTEYEQSTKAEIEEVIAEYNQAETDQSRPDRMSLEQTELNQHQVEVRQ